MPSVPSSASPIAIRSPPSEPPRLDGLERRRAASRRRNPSAADRRQPAAVHLDVGGQVGRREEAFGQHAVGGQRREMASGAPAKGGWRKIGDVSRGSRAYGEEARRAEGGSSTVAYSGRLSSAPLEETPCSRCAPDRCVSLLLCAAPAVRRQVGVQAGLRRSRDSTGSPICRRSMSP